MLSKMITEGETVLIYANKQKRFWEAVARSAIVSFVPPLLIIEVMYLPILLVSSLNQSYSSQSISAPLVSYICLGVFIVVFSNLVITALELKDLPSVVLSYEGLTICNGLWKIGPIRWNEIEEARVLERERGYCVGIIPFDTNRLCKRLGGLAAWWILRGLLNTPLLMIFQWYDELVGLIRIPVAHRLYSLLSTPIVISDRLLPLSADDLAARIREYRENRL